MIVFHTLEYSNFLSTGDKPTLINFEQSPSTLVVGHNGSGKSTMLDALSFGLFGKAHRNIKKSQLVNSINGRGAVVAVTFTVNGSTYRVVRGISPAKFEIWKDDEMFDQASHAKEYQRMLEDNVLKLSHKSFHQIVVLGSSSFIPFMQLNNNTRRDVIEDLLDIGVFSKMNMILKDRQSVLKGRVQQLLSQIENTTHRIGMSSKYIEDIARINQDHKNSKLQAIAANVDQIKALEKENDKIRIPQDKLAEHLAACAKVESKLDKLRSFQVQFTTQIKPLDDQTQFYQNNDHCPSCDQMIAEDHKHAKIESSSTKADQIREALQQISDQLKEQTTEHEQLVEVSNSMNASHNQINLNLRTIQNLMAANKTVQSEIDSLTDDTSNVSKAKQDLVDLEKELHDFREEKISLAHQGQYNAVISELLKDSGIKTKIIKQYLPVINQLVNQYLTVLDFYVHFDLDEQFQETIRSRHRDSFSYDSFSEGEKQRIDLALLFTWRQIAKMKNSVSTNLLMLDETFDSSLDEDGVENLMKILHTVSEDTNVFVISHKGDLLDGKFDDKIEFTKDRNFSVMKR